MLNASAILNAVRRAETGDGDLQRANGEIRLKVSRRKGRSVVAECYQRSPCRVLFPRADGGERLEAVLLNTAGGVAGGDFLRQDFSADAGATLTVTTATAEKIYRALDRCGRIETRLEAADGAALEWLPQETIVFDGARLHRATDIALAPGARVLALDWMSLGRAASQETMTRGEISDRWRVFRGGRLVWADCFRIDGDIAAQTARPALLAGRRALATIVYAAPDAPGQIERARALLAGAARHGETRAGATVVSGLLLCRIASKTADDLRRTVI